MTVLASAMMLSACQPKKEEPKPELEKPKAEIQDLSQKLIGDSEELQLNLPDCNGNSCPDLSVERLNSNQSFIDDFVDQKVLQLLSEILSVEPAKVQSDHASSEAASSSEAQSALAKVETPKLKLENQSQPFVAAFLDLDKELKELSSAQQISIMIKPKILNAEKPLATVVLNSSSYLGGAHGSSAQQYYNFDLKTKRLIKLDDLILPNKNAALDKQAHTVFKTWVSETKLADNIEEYEQAWKFKLTNNYYLGKDGLILQYGEYEIGPYVVGLPRLTIPYSQLEGVLKPQYLPAQADATSEAKHATSEAKLAK